MTRILPLLSLVAAAALAGCSSFGGMFGGNKSSASNQTATPTTASTSASSTAQARLGTGTVESVAALPASAAAGGSAQGPWYRVGIRMQDGQVQYIQTNAPNLSVGEQVTISSNGLVTQR